VSVLWLIFGLVALLLSTACQSGAARVDTGPKPPVAQGTITGTIRGAEATSPVSGRTVEIVNIGTGERHSATTTSSGGFTSHLPPGKYRFELALRTGETLVAQPEVVSLDRGGKDPHVEIVLGPTRVVRPRGPAYHVDNGLGSPSA
jgi:carboxypeptidase family protein